MTVYYGEFYLKFFYFEFKIIIGKARHQATTIFFLAIRLTLFNRSNIFLNFF